MKQYKLNIIFGGNIEIPIKAKNDDEAINKAYSNIVDKNDFIKLFKKYGQLITFEPTVITAENGEEIEI